MNRIIGKKMKLIKCLNINLVSILIIKIYNYISIYFICLLCVKTTALYKE